MSPASLWALTISLYTAAEGAALLKPSAADSAGNHLQLVFGKLHAGLLDETLSLFLARGLSCFIFQQLPARSQAFFTKTTELSASVTMTLS